MDLITITKDLQVLSLDSRDLCTAALQKYIENALGYLPDPKLKRTSIQVCLRHSSIIFIFILISHTCICYSASGTRHWR